MLSSISFQLERSGGAAISNCGRSNYNYQHESVPLIQLKQSGNAPVTISGNNLLMAHNHKINDLMNQ